VKRKPVLLTSAILLLSISAFFHVSEAAPSGSKTEKKDKATAYYEEGVQLAETGDFDKALERFEKANKERKNDADILNMMAFAQRKLGRLNEAFENYARALEIRPDFPQAREYLGEAHLQAALEQAKILSEYGSLGEEELAQLMAAFEEAAWRLGIRTDGNRSGSAERKW
jgi:tetratricopeptide (TPR) repeat protein